ncbi:MAG: ECF transporter S component [Bacillota bacterium]|nr:ECF transporter S component [Bacillota bacterium]
MRESTSKLTTANIAIYGIMMALTTVATMVISIPSIATKGYINLGDAMVILAGFVLGPVGGLTVGGIGSALADILLGYAYYAPFTLVVKGLEGLIVALLYRKALKGKLSFVAGAVGGIFMAFGYFVVEIFMYDLPAAIASLPGNIFQGLVGAFLATILLKSLGKKLF